MSPSYRTQRSGKHGLLQQFLIPGTYYTTAATWTKKGNSLAWSGYRDPVGGPFMFEMHQYFDANYSGQSNTCVAGYGSSVLTFASNGYKGFIAEFGWFNINGAVSAACQTEGTALMDALQSHPEQWAGWTWWGSGPWAGNSGVNLDPGLDGISGHQPQIATLLNSIP
jgi:endoglucanase